jgi:hypothetical protein
MNDLITDFFANINPNTLSKANAALNPAGELQVTGTFAARLKTILDDKKERVSPEIKNHPSGSCQLFCCFEIVDSHPSVNGLCIWEHITLIPSRMDDINKWKEKQDAVMVRALCKIIAMSGNDSLRNINKPSPALYQANFNATIGYQMPTHRMNKKVIIKVRRKNTGELDVFDILPYQEGFVLAIDKTGDKK